jgi:hypothetical protein
MLCDPDYVRSVAAATGGSDIEVSVTAGDDGGATIVSARSLPAEVPSYARGFVGDRIALTETRVLGPAGPDGSRDGSVVVSFGSAPATVEGTLRLAAEGSGSVIEVAMNVVASVPFIGGKIERMIADQIGAALTKEEQVAGERLG